MRSVHRGRFYIVLRVARRFTARILLRLFPATFLVFLARAAGTRIVAADLRSAANDRCVADALSIHEEPAPIDALELRTLVMHVVRPVAAIARDELDLAGGV